MNPERGEEDCNYYHSLACRLLRLVRNIFFPETLTLCFVSVTVATPILFSLTHTRAELTNKQPAKAL